MAIDKLRNMVIASSSDEASWSDFLLFSQKVDNLITSQSGALTYLRVELARIRAGMNDYLIRVSTPKTAGSKPIVVTIRGNKQFSTSQGAEKVAMVIAREMSTRGDKQHDWDKVNVEHLAKMIVNQLKFFTVHNQSTLLRFSTDALA